MFNILSHKGNTNKNYFEILLLESEWPRLIKQMTVHAGQSAGEGDTHSLPVGVGSGKVTTESSVEVPQNADN